MSLLDTKYDIELYFSDLVNVIKHDWNTSFFDLKALSIIQLETGMVDGTFEGVYHELLAAYYDESSTRYENMANILFKAISKYLKQDKGSKRPRHIYMPGIALIGGYGNISTYPTYAFTIWDDYQREYAFEMKFSFKNE